MTRLRVGGRIRGKEKRTVRGEKLAEREEKRKGMCKWRRETGGRGKKRVWYCYSYVCRYMKNGVELRV